MFFFSFHRYASVNIGYTYVLMLFHLAKSLTEVEGLLFFTAFLC